MSHSDHLFDKALEEILEAMFLEKTELSLSGLGIDKLPKAIKHLKELRSLDLSNNNLKQLPVELFSLSNLRTLHLSQNNLTNIPSELSLLSNLKFLRAEGNDLADIPMQIGNLSKLEGLYLRDNKLKSIPSSMGLLSELKRLDLSNNEIQQLPKQLTQLNYLKSLLIHENNLDIPKEILGPNSIGNKEAQKILSFLEESYQGQKQQLNETKMLIVGQGGVGKTSMVRSLLGEGFDPDSAKTDGIDIRKLPLELQDDRMVQFNIWDFGGQEVMHATHQFFLTQRSIYLLVLDARMDRRGNRPDYWLNLIEQYGGANAPIIILINKIDDNMILNLNETSLKKRFNVVSIIKTSCKTGKGISQLKQTILQTIDILPHISDSLPMTWFSIKQALEEKMVVSDVVSFKFFQRLCKKEGLEEDSRLVLLKLLHDLGVVLDFYDPITGDLREEANIVDPKWVTAGVYKIINSKEIFHEQGVLIKNRLPDILDVNQYPTRAMRESILNIMEKFELAFPFAGGAKYLIPDLLPETEPEIQGFDETLNFEYHYNNFVPPSVLSRFIVRQHEKIRNRQKELWRNGVVIHFDMLKALVKAEESERKLIISVQGDMKRRRELLAIIRDTFDAIHGSFAKLIVKAMVPIPGKSDAAVSYKALVAAIHNKMPRVYVEGLDEFILARPLFDGVEPQKLSDIRKSLGNKLSFHELKQVCVEFREKHDQNFDHENFGPKKNEFIVDLLSYLEKRSAIDDFLSVCQENFEYFSVT